MYHMGVDPLTLRLSGLSLNCPDFQDLYRKIKGYVYNLHNKTANFLVKNYKMIVIPEFETSNMIKNYKKIL